MAEFRWATTDAFKWALDIAYKRGWDAAGDGRGAHENPYPAVNSVPLGEDDKLILRSPQEIVWATAGAYSEMIPGQSRHSLWLSGFADYCASPNYCMALWRYLQFKRNGIPMEYSDAWTLCYEDGSRIELKSERVGFNSVPVVRAYNVNGKLFAQLQA